jgi:hypothetical protein
VLWKVPFNTFYSKCQKSIPFPYIQVVVCLLNPSEASSRFP